MGCDEKRGKKRLIIVKPIITDNYHHVKSVFASDSH